MGKDIYVVAEHLKGKPADVTFEMLGKGRELADGTGGHLVCVLMGKGVRNISRSVGVADQVLHLEHEQLADFNPEAMRLTLAELIRNRQPWLTLIGSTSAGYELAAPISASLGIPLVAACKGLTLEGDVLVATSQLYGGKIMAEVEIERHPAIACILPGAFRAEKGQSEKSPVVEEVAVTASIQNLRVLFDRLVEPEAGDTDITQVPVLVSVGRGIQTKENIELAEELAQELGGAVSASRPVVDQGWLPLSRQVGRSGMIVKPKLYLAVGISGAPEHAEGMRDAEVIIAVNSDAAAPIFGIAHFGIVGDAIELLPAMTQELKSRKAR